MPAWITKENVTFAIAVIGFLLSIYNFLKVWLANRRNLSVSIPCLICTCGDTYIKMVFVNKSNMPITITRICAHAQGADYELGLSTVRIFEYDHPERKGRAGDDTTCLPLKLEPLGYRTALFELGSLASYQEDMLSITIGTNRGPIESDVHVQLVTDDYKTMSQYLG